MTWPFKPLQLANFKTVNAPALATTITGTSLATVYQQLLQAQQSPAEIIEWRLDYLLSVQPPALSALTLADFQKIQNFTTKPLILTWRTTSQGGKMQFDLPLYERYYQWALKAGFAAVDLEWPILAKLPDLVAMLQGKIALICSWHDYQKVPADFLKIGEKMGQTAAQIVKIAVTPQSKPESKNFLHQTAILNQKISQPLISIGMGPIGQPSRIWGFKYGSSLTFGQLANCVAAPGQIPLQKLQQEVLKATRGELQEPLDKPL